MNITINTVNKTIDVDQKLTLQELDDTLNMVLKEPDWRNIYKIEFAFNYQIPIYPNPDVVNPPFITYCDGTTQTIKNYPTTDRKSVV